MKQINNSQAGFTLIELIIAALIIIFGMLAMGTFLGGQVKQNSKNERQTVATILAQQKIEELRNMALIGGVSSADNSVSPHETIPSSVTGAGPFVRSWVIDDVTNPNLDQITVTVDWETNGMGISEVTLTTQLTNS